MSVIIGREKEERELEYAYQSNSAQLIALYGRRRVGKTYLVSNFFRKKKGGIFLYVTGAKNAPQKDQLANFYDRFVKEFSHEGVMAEKPKTWREAFGMLTRYIEVSKRKKITIFFDEFPWMVTRGSRLLRIFEYYWNQYWSHDGRITMILCGSASSWILRNIVNNTGGLYNRVTTTIHLEPFNLAQTKDFLDFNKVRLSSRDIVDLYMVLGGIPFYLSKVKPGLSSVQIIDELAFTKQSFLLREFGNVFETLFNAGGGHEELVRIIAEHRAGVGLTEILASSKDLSSGGRISTWLRDLEDSGFISKFYPYKNNARGIFYKISDEYTLFYFKWIEPVKRYLLHSDKAKGYWKRYVNTPSWNSWAGSAFEAICYKHVSNICDALKLDELSLAATWRYVPKKDSNDRGAQIDLLFDRPDKAITLCEIKYTRQPYVFNKEAYENMLRKIAVFKEQTKTIETIFVALISASGIKKTRYTEELITGVVILEDLFKHRR